MTCRACGNEVLDSKVRMTLTDRYSENKRKVDFFECLECGNFSADPILDEKYHLNRYKNNHSWGLTSDEKWYKFFSMREKSQYKINKKIVNNFGKHFNKSSFIKHLDVACAEGVLVTSVSSNTYWLTSGIEIDKNASSWGSSRGRNITNQKFSSSVFKAGEFDLVSIHEALDHFNSISKVLNQINEITKKDGMISLVHTFYNFEHEEKNDKFHHSTYFTMDGIKNILTKHGYKFIKAYRLPKPGKFPRNLLNKRFINKYQIIGVKL
jgi:ubiquinone/menaquinone biosynthesis C-methylase UbiE